MEMVVKIKNIYIIFINNNNKDILFGRGNIYYFFTK